MQPILAESVPHRSRAFAVVSALAVSAGLCFAAMTSAQYGDSHREHHRTMRPFGKCAHGSYQLR